MKVAKKAVKSPQDSSKAQQARNPMLAVRLPRSAYKALQRAARAEHRQFPDWFRLNVHKMLPAREFHTLSDILGVSASAGVARESESK